MRISSSLLLPTLIGAASAATDPARVYIFQNEDFPAASKPATLTPEEARLVIAHRLEVSQYHALNGASKSTLAYINTFGGKQDTLFEDSVRNKPSELVVVVEGVSPSTAAPLLKSWETINPAFLISNPPSSRENKKLTSDLNQQSYGMVHALDCDLEEAINPYNEKCWAGPSKIMHLDMKTEVKGHINIDDFMAAQEKFRKFAKNEAMNVVVVLMPESSRFAKVSSESYGSYEMPSNSQKSLNRRQQVEEPMTESSFFASGPLTVSHIEQVDQAPAENTTYAPLKGVIPFCHISLDACISATNNCSGHGSCYGKYNSTDGKSGCFTCGCIPTQQFVGPNQEFLKTTYWGGAACQKQDISGPFWLLAGLTIVIVGIVGWGIGMLFSIGEEKLPGVIGAGVSSKTR